MTPAAKPPGTIGFVGLGQMGQPMARRLLDAGYSVAVHDVARARSRSLGQLGAAEQPSAADVARFADVIFVMVPARHVSEALVGKRGLLRGIRLGAVVIEGGNSDPAESIRFAEIFRQAGATMLDIGFSGGAGGAAAGRLAMMVGGPQASFERVEPVLRSLGCEVGYFGDSGSGHLAKALNHLVQGLTAQAIGEALAIAEASGLDIEEWLRVASQGAAASWLIDRAREMTKRAPADPDDVTAWWAGHGARNQLSYALEAAESSSVAVPLAAVAHQIRSLSLASPRSRAMEFYVQLTWAFAHAPDDAA
jgi:2-hydroxy-3-oxopropionate reductase